MSHYCYYFILLYILLCSWIINRVLQRNIHKPQYIFSTWKGDEKRKASKYVRRERGIFRRIPSAAHRVLRAVVLFLLISSGMTHALNGPFTEVNLADRYSDGSLLALWGYHTWYILSTQCNSLCARVWSMLLKWKHILA